MAELPDEYRQARVDEGVQIAPAGQASVLYVCLVVSVAVGSRAVSWSDIVGALGQFERAPFFPVLPTGAGRACPAPARITGCLESPGTRRQ